MKTTGAIILFAQFCLYSFQMNAGPVVQSTFKGPVELKVWQHWQQSWNVENASQDYLFEIQRGEDLSHTPFVKIKFKNNQEGLRAQINCESYVPKDMWSMHKVQSENYTQNSLTTDLESNYFVFENVPCVDSPQTRITTQINFKILNSMGEELYNESLRPMYLRGKKQNYWDNEIPAYSAHAGEGEISVANGLNAENGQDTWGETLVRPTLNFVDRNRMKKDSFIGLHRHEKNQEAYLIEEGQATMIVGVAYKIQGSDERVTRKWSLAGDTQETSQFSANGGWIEERSMSPGQISVIVPNPDRASTVYFHGIKAEEDTVFFTMGTKN
ncbi:MAG: hypothetical protein R3A80_13610 [Bdellovibrionota bacterium]